MTENQEFGRAKSVGQQKHVTFLLIRTSAEGHSHSADLIISQLLTELN